MELKKGLPIRPSEMGVLNIITGRPGPHTPVMVAQLLGVSKPMITALLTSLAEKDYITKEPSKDDKRAYYIIPTEKALALVESAKQEMDGHFSQMIDGMGQDNFETLVRLAQMANKLLEADRGERK
ncbi:MAG: MarR family transcriptional regulator [Oscillospiraceae bacterium]|nr:MarR family transcriptional regulator [Oscillospiraceae bacterium]